MSDDDNGFSLCLALTPLVPQQPGLHTLSGDVGVAERSALFYVGVGIAVVSSFFQALGMYLQKYAHVLEQSKPQAQQRHMCYSLHWHIGLYLYVLSQTAGQIMALQFLSPVILAPLGSITLVFNAVFAKVFLKELFTWTNFIGTAVVVTGAVLIAVFGYAPESAYALDELVALFASVSMIVFVSCVAGLVGLLFVWSKYVQFFLTDYDNRAGFLRYVGRDRLLSLLGLTYAGMAGMMGSGTILLAKVSLQLLTTSINGDNQFIYAGTYIIIGALVFLAVSQVVFLNSGLATAAVSLVVPVFFCVWTVFTMAQTMTYYNQFPCFSTIQITCVVLGIVTIIVGVACLSWATPTPAVQPSSLSIQGEDDGVIIQTPPDFVVAVDDNTTEGTPLLHGTDQIAPAMRRVPSFKIAQPTTPKSQHRRVQSEQWRQRAHTSPNESPTIFSTAADDEDYDIVVVPPQRKNTQQSSRSQAPASMRRTQSNVTGRRTSTTGSVTSSAADDDDTVDERPASATAKLL